MLQGLGFAAGQVPEEVEEIGRLFALVVVSALLGGTFLVPSRKGCGTLLAESRKRLASTVVHYPATTVGAAPLPENICARGSRFSIRPASCSRKSDDWRRPSHAGGYSPEGGAVRELN